MTEQGVTGKESSINNVGRAGQGEGVSGKTMFVHIGGGRGLRLVHVDKLFYDYLFCAYEFKCPFGVTVIPVTVLNIFLE